MAIISYPTYLQPNAPDDIVGFNIQTLTAQSPRHVSFGQAFIAGKVPRDAGLIAKIGATAVPAQMDVKTRHPDGTVRFAVITVPAPALSANADLKLMLALSPDPPAYHIPVLAALKRYDVVVTLSGGVAASINVGSRLIEAIRAKTHSYWLRGGNAVQARVDIPVRDALHLVADVTCYADGTFLSDLQFRNDHAMQDYGGTLNYSANISQAGTTIFSATVKHFQYEGWRRVFHTAVLPTSDTHNVQHDVAYLIRAGALQNYDLTSGIDDAYIENYTTTNVAPLVNPGWYEAMPSAGHRGDIGPMPEWYARWVKCQGWKAARAALVMGNGAGSIPWHHFDPTTGDFLDLDTYPTLWIDYRGTPKLTPDVADPRWYLDNAHTPDVAFIPYLFTGDRYFLDELVAQTSRQIMALWNAPRQNGKGIIVVGSDAFEVRAQVWTFRNLIETAWAVPDNSPAKSYWIRILDNNYAFILDDIIPDWTQKAKDVAGYFYGVYGYTQMAVWQQDYMVSVLGLAVALRPRNNAHALKMLKWAQNFNVGRFTHQAQGFGLAAAVSYQMWIATDPGRVWYDTWAELGAANGAGNDLPQDGGTWVPLGLETLATIWNLTGNTQALASYNSLKAANVPGTRTVDYQTRYPQFHIVPAPA